MAIPGGNRLMGISRNSRFHPGQEGISGFRDTVACGEGASPPGPHPPGRCPPRSPARGEPGDTPRSPPTLRWMGTSTRTDMGVQQSLNLADSQPGTQVHPWLGSRQWGLAPPQSHLITMLVNPARLPALPTPSTVLWRL